MGRRVRWGVIGCGGIADRRTIPEGIMPADNSELVAVMDIDEGKAKDVASKYGVPKWYASDVELVRDQNVDAVYIATPVNVHAKQVLMAAENGKHVLCEKPLAMTMDDCRKVAEACRVAGVKLGVGLMMRFHACHRAMREVIASGEIGKPVMGRAQLTCWYPRIPGAWRQDPAQSGGGALMDLGIHTIDLLRTLLGEVQAVIAFAENVVQEYPVDDSSVVLLRFVSGAMGVVESFFNIPDAAAQNALEIYGTKGCILARGTIGQGSSGSFVVYSSFQEGYEAKQTRTSGDISVREVVPEPVNIYQAEIEAFADAILHDTEPPVSAEDGNRSMECLLAAYQSAREGRRIDV